MTNKHCTPDWAGMQKWSESLQIGICSDLGGGEEFGARHKGIEPLKAPGAKEAGEYALRVTTPCGTCAPTDLPTHRDRPKGSLGGIVVRRHSQIDHEVEELSDEPVATLTQHALWNILIQEGCA